MPRLIVLLISLLWAPWANAEPESKILVLLTKSGGPIDANTFVLALSLQLDSYGIEHIEADWSPPENLSLAIDLAREMGKASGVAAVLWYQAKGDDITVYIADIVGDKTLLRSLRVASSGKDAERTLALSARTLLRASLLEYADSLPVDSSLSRLAKEGATTQNTRPQSQIATVVALNQASKELGFSLNTRAFPGGKEVYQGLTAELGLPMSQSYSLVGGVGVRLPRVGESEAGSFRLAFYDLDLSLQRALLSSQARRLSLGPSARLGLLRASATQGEQRQSAWLTELAVGAAVQGELPVGTRARLCVALGLAGLPLSHRLLVGGEEVSRSGNLELFLSTGLRFTTKK